MAGTTNVESKAAQTPKSVLVALRGRVTTFLIERIQRREPVDRRWDTYTDEEYDAICKANAQIGNHRSLRN